MFSAALFLSLASIGELQAPPPPVPVDPEKRAAQSIQKNLGVEFSVLESKLRRSIIRTKTPYGFKIKSIQAKSVAATAGWQAGDVLLEWNGVPIKNLSDLDDGLQKAGDTATFKLARYKKNQPAMSRQPWEDVEGKIKLKP